MPVPLENVSKLLNWREPYKGYKLAACLTDTPNNIVLFHPYSGFKKPESVTNIQKLEGIIQNPGLPLVSTQQQSAAAAPLDRACAY